MFLKQTKKLNFTFLPSQREIESNLKCFASNMCIYSSLNCFNNYTTINCQSNYAYCVFHFWRESVNLFCSLYHLNCFSKLLGFRGGWYSLGFFKVLSILNLNRIVSVNAWHSLGFI
jgi:hypothetical protein